jgi:hypothetical protein
MYIRLFSYCPIYSDKLMRYFVQFVFRSYYMRFQPLAETIFHWVWMHLVS